MLWSRILPWLPVLAATCGGLAALAAGGPPTSEGHDPAIHRAADDAPQGYVGSGACQSCHAGPHASWQGSYHRTMTRRTSDLPFDQDGGPSLPARLEERDDGTPGFELTRRGTRVMARGPDLHWLGAGLEKLATARARRDASDTDALDTSALDSDASDTVATGTVALDTVALERELLRRAPRVERELVLGTGSHHYLAFWLAGDPGSELRQLPWVWLLAERRWIPRREAFLAPDDEPLYVPRWNSSCIQCHAVAGEPHESEGDHPTPWVRYETRVAELGIACEACHGPGKRHADSLRAPWAREAARELVDARAPMATDDPAEPPLHIVNPARLDAAQASAVCGQCHAYFLVQHPDEWWTWGHTKRASPAVDLADSRRLLSAGSTDAAAEAAFSRELSSIFWADGSVRVGGREYNGLVESPCYLRGRGAQQLGCSSCHSMHDYPAGSPASQLRTNAEGTSDTDAACLDCHQRGDANFVEHSGHAPSSPGSRCVGCHMPKTSYALLRAIPSHRIGSPSRRLTDPPSACVLCHLDASSAWLDRELLRLYPRLADAPAPAPPAATAPPGATAQPGMTALPGTTAQSDEPLGLRLLLAGDAATRAILANALAEPSLAPGIDESLKRELWQRLARDPYPAVRHIAERELARSRAAANTAASSATDSSANGAASSASGATNSSANGATNSSANGATSSAASSASSTASKAPDANLARTLDEWTRQRDDRPVVISE